MNSECRQQNISFNERRIDTNRRWIVVRFIIAVILLIAAVLKAHQLATTPLLGEGLLHNRWFNIFVVEFELFFGIWLIFGLLPKLTWLATIGLFSIFSVISFYEAISGFKSCNCFGNVTVNPWITMAFDLMITGLLLILLPKKNIFHKKIFWKGLTGLKQKIKIVAVVGIWLVVTVPIMLAMLSVNIVTLTEESHLSENEKSILKTVLKWSFVGSWASRPQ
ncbi:MAG: hypothetical protein LBC74_15770 [Planctomycetaceae bacterium]|jgi:hypothetical protein|nr:hypothetical protein [Planctomycetaceae bacterium]